MPDVLASYELRLGTVGYIGYAVLYERHDFIDERWVQPAGDYLTPRRGFFMKASYLYRF